MLIKTLFLLRHAKSSWESPELDDHDRPLNDRGRRAATRMGRLMKEQSIVPELILCSNAKRTRETAKLVFANFAKFPAIEYLDELYHANPQTIMKVVSQVADPIRFVMLIGHNPGFEEFLGDLAGAAQRFPTASLARIDYALDTWSQILSNPDGKLIEIWRPRELDTD